MGSEAGRLPEGAVAIGDALYDNTAAGQVAAQHGVRVFAAMQFARGSDRFSNEAATDQMVCSQRQRSIGSIAQENGRLYYFSVADCTSCTLKTQCPTPSELAGAQRQRVYLSHFRKSKFLAGEVGKQWRRQMYRECYEPRHGIGGR